MKKLFLLPVTLIMALVLGTSVAMAATISNTGPGSTNIITHNNDCDVDVTNDTDVDINVDTDQDANTGTGGGDDGQGSGGASNTGNTTGGNATSGDASNDSDVDASVDISNGGVGCDPVAQADDPADEGQGGDDPEVAGEFTQVVPPVGGADAGAGGASSSSGFAAFGALASVALVGLGIRRALTIAE